MAWMLSQMACEGYALSQSAPLQPQPLKPVHSLPFQK
jgi:hypothetical protein